VDAVVASSRLIDRVPLGAAITDAGAILDRFVRWVADSGLTPYAHQEEALLELAAGKHVVLATPTGSGKSLVALGLHFKALCEGKRSFYTAPIKALVNEKFFALCETLGRENVGMMTGDASINWAAPVICCTQEVLANMALRQGERLDAPYVVVDEFHFYGDRERGWAWQLPLIALRHSNFLLMSATLGNTAPIEERLEEFTGRPVAHVWSEDRPVPLDFAYRETPLHETVEDLLDEKRAPIYVVNFTQREAVEVASALTSAKIATREMRQRIAELTSTVRFDTPFGREMKRIVSHGIGLHHAGLLPKYRLLVEQLAQEGLLRVIAGTDTLGVGVNIPIRTVLFTKLSKFDGERVRILSARDFKQIAGRAGRRGFDTRGSVVCQAPEHLILAKRAQRQGKREKAAPHKRRPPPGFVGWTKDTFEQLVKRQPEALNSVFRVSHGMMISVLQRTRAETGKRGGYGALVELITRSHETASRKRRLARDAAVLFRALRRAGIVEVANHEARVAPDLQADFSLHQSLSLYFVDAITALDREAPEYHLQVIGVAEAVIENPNAILQQQLKVVKSELMEQLKADRVPFEERIAKLDEVTLPAPEADFIYATFRVFAEHHPWVAEEGVHPKSIAREIVEHDATFEGVVRRYGLQRSEGVLLRYLSQVHATLDQSVPDAAKTEALEDAIASLREIVRGTDSSLLAAWENLGAPPASAAAAPASEAAPARSRRRPRRDLAHDIKALRARVHAELRAFVRALAEGDYEEAAKHIRQDEADPWDAVRLAAELRPYLETHGELRFDPAAGRGHHTSVKQFAPRLMRVQHTLLGEHGVPQGWIDAEVDIREGGEPEGPLARLIAIQP
jgi:superfamily II RNA helicase